MSTETATDGFRPLKDWFSFELRCLVCGRKVGQDAFNTTRPNHLASHCAEGVLERNEEGGYRQVKAHLAGFPGILLPKWMEWTK